MKASDLRIGNIYHSVKFNKPVVCTLSDLYDLCAKSDGAYNDPPIDEMFEPIILTEQWLLKFGFKQWGSYRHLWKVGRNHTVTIEGGDDYSPPFEFRVRIGYIEIKYVHQLQNLYFALTGKELEYTFD